MARIQVSWRAISPQTNIFTTKPKQSIQQKEKTKKKKKIDNHEHRSEMRIHSRAPSLGVNDHRVLSHCLLHGVFEARTEGGRRRSHGLNGEGSASSGAMVAETDCGDWAGSRDRNVAQRDWTNVGFSCGGERDGGKIGETSWDRHFRCLWIFFFATFWEFWRVFV